MPGTSVTDVGHIAPRCIEDLAALLRQTGPAEAAEVEARAAAADSGDPRP